MQLVQSEGGSLEKDKQEVTGEIAVVDALKQNSRVTGVPVKAQMAKAIKDLREDDQAHFTKLTEKVFRAKKQKIHDAREEEKKAFRGKQLVEADRHEKEEAKR